MRSNGQQRLHDQVIGSVAKVLAEMYPREWIHTNPGTMRRFEVSGHWPDVVLTDGDGIPHGIYEVETSDTLTESHASGQWAGLARLAPSFYLVVPERDEEAAKRLLRQLKIKIAKLVLF